MQDWTRLADENIVRKTVDALKSNGIEAIIVNNGEEAKAKVLELIPEGSEVMNQTSITLETIGLVKEINESGRFDSVKNKLTKMNRETDSKKMQMLGTAPDFTIGSVHAVTEHGQVIVASNTGSQLGSYAYASPHVIWIAGTQKIVRDIDEGLKRISDFILPLESARARKAYGLPDTYNSFPSKILIFNREVKKQRITLIFVKEILGF